MPRLVPEVEDRRLTFSCTWRPGAASNKSDSRFMISRTAARARGVDLPPQHRTHHNTKSESLICSPVDGPSPPGLWESGNPAPFAGFPSGVEKLFLLFHACLLY